MVEVTLDMAKMITPEPLGLHTLRVMGLVRHLDLGDYALNSYTVKEHDSVGTPLAI